MAEEIYLSNNDDEIYSSAVMKRAVARACLAFGYKNSESYSIDALADVTREYIQAIATAAQNQAELSTRPFAGLQDVMEAVESMVR
jgi:histone H3/H4